MITWYTVAWFEKYLKHDPAADKLLLTKRWQHDPISAAVDPGHDGNAFSFYYRSRLDIHLANGHAFDCENLRAGCRGMVSNDGYRGSYSYLKVDTSRDVAAGADASLSNPSSLYACPANPAEAFTLSPLGGQPITQVQIYLDGRLAATRSAPLPNPLMVPGFAGPARHTVRLNESTSTGAHSSVTRTLPGCPLSG